MQLNNRKAYILLFIILVVSAILRFYKLPEMVNFDFDQEYASNFAYAVLKEYPIQLIGQGLSIQGLFMGPLYFYYLVPFYALTNLHPIGGYIGSVILGLLTIFVYFWVGKKMFGTEAGLIAAFLRGLLFSVFGGTISGSKNYLNTFLEYLTVNLYGPYWIFGITEISKQLFSFILFSAFISLIIKKMDFGKIVFTKLF